MGHGAGHLPLRTVATSGEHGVAGDAKIAIGPRRPRNQRPPLSGTAVTAVGDPDFPLADAFAMAVGIATAVRRLPPAEPSPVV